MPKGGDRWLSNLPDRAASERETLVATKFHVGGAGFLPRPRVVAHLARGMARGLTLVWTPAGFGKTTLLGDWARRSRRPVAWLSLDEADNDPARNSRRWTPWRRPWSTS